VVPVADACEQQLKVSSHTTQMSNPADSSMMSNPTLTVSPCLLEDDAFHGLDHKDGHGQAAIGT
jgi:hypothetical protein